MFTCCWGSNLSIQVEVGKLNGDLLQPSRIRYKVWSFSVRYLISIAYWKGLIFGVKLSVVVPQAIGISLHNRIGDSTGEFLVVVLWVFSIGIQWLWIALFLLFLCRVWGHVFLVASDWCEVCLSLSVCLYFYALFFLYESFELTVMYIHGFDCYIRVHRWVYYEQARIPLVFPSWRRLIIAGWILRIVESPLILLESVYTSVSDQRRFF